MQIAPRPRKGDNRQSDVELRILGPLEAADDGGPVELTGGKQKALLALLLLDAGRVLSVERVIDALWGDDVPESARKMVQIFVSQLRKQLPPGLIETRPPGYRCARRPLARPAPVRDTPGTRT